MDADRLRRPTLLEGVSLSEVLAAGTGLYEITTPSGVPVRAHDMSLMRLAHEAERRTLHVELLYDDPKWTPRAAEETPLAVFAFDDVEILDDQNEPGTPQDDLRHVLTFDYHQSSDIFAVTTCTRYLVFRASRLVLTLRPAPSR